MGLLVISLHLPKPTGKGGICTRLFMMQYAQKFLSVNWKISLVSSPRPLQSHFSSAASLGFALYGTLWCAGLGTHPMSTCSSPTALSILGKSSSSISSTHVVFFGLWSMHSFPGAVRDWERWRNEGADECLLNEEAYWHQARVLAF